MTTKLFTELEMRQLAVLPNLCLNEQHKIIVLLFESDYKIIY